MDSCEIYSNCAIYESGFVEHLIEIYSGNHYRDHGLAYIDSEELRFVSLESKIYCFGVTCIHVFLLYGKVKKNYDKLVHMSTQSKNIFKTCT